MCVRNPERTLQHAALIDPGCAGHFAVAVEGKSRREDRFMILLPAWVDDCYTGPGGGTFDHGGISHRHTGNVGDGVVLAGRAFKGDAQVASAWFGHEAPFIRPASWYAIPSIT